MRTDGWFEQSSEGTQEGYASCCKESQGIQISREQKEETAAIWQTVPWKESMEMIKIL